MSAKSPTQSDQVGQHKREGIGTPAPTASVLEYFKSLLSVRGILVPTVIIGAIGYFMGWRFLYAYYGAFGLDPVFFSFSPTEVVAAGWRMYGFITLILAFAAFLLAIGQEFADHLIQRKKPKFLIRVFLGLWMVSLVINGFVVYQFFFIWGAHSMSSFYIWAFVGLTFLWISFILGERIHATSDTSPFPANSQATFFRIVFPTPQVWLLLISLYFVIIIVLISSWNGLAYSIRDRGPLTRLQIVTMYINKQLSLPDGQETCDEVWRYDDLRLLFKTDDTYFVFRLDEVTDDIVTLYAIPKEHVIELHLKSWYDKVVHP